MAARKTHEIKTRGITILQNGHKEIRRLKKASHTPSIHGHKVWNSSYVVMDYLKRKPPAKGSHLMDIGCGWGILGIYAAKRLDVQVTGVDADPDVLPYLTLHAALNCVDITPLRCRFEKLTSRKLQGVETITGADICFWDELTPVLFKLIRRALKAGVQRIIIADPGRAPFYALAELCQEKLNARVIERRTANPKPASADLLIIEAG
ncbi:methyltransferase domain-containing protein [Alcanivorax sp. JB21]|uniref:class I SAM-dependent methyltransferase n=1 Tax=Alcanivorax limicola TaxID=2874102 RepID=UPI001CBD4D0A|nr:class I SAM-dependent methyltransferase [Alcanivorax limicola]MBZ2187963.1 methyltransferase domain-containing protein [Alcanivorax limicola]